MKTAFTDLVIQNTPKNTEVEVRRIFTKIINPLAYKHNTFGTRKREYFQYTHYIR